MCSAASRFLAPISLAWRTASWPASFMFLLAAYPSTMSGTLETDRNEISSLARIPPRFLMNMAILCFHKMFICRRIVTAGATTATRGVLFQQEGTSSHHMPLVGGCHLIDLPAALCRAVSTHQRPVLS